MVSHSKRRAGAVLVESAIIYSVAFLLFLGILVGGMGVFRYQETSHIARDAARWASAHGAEYRKVAGTYPGSTGGTYDRTDATPAPGIMWYKVDASSATAGTWVGDIYLNAISPNIVSLDPAAVTVEIGWPQVTNTAGVVVQNSPDNWRGSKVFVQVNYNWLPEALLVGPITLTSTSSMPVTN